MRGQQGNVLPRRQMWKQATILDDVSHALTLLLDILGSDGSAIELNGTGICVDQSD